MDEDFEQVLLVKPDVFVYRIPPKIGTKAHRASDWKLDTPDWTGRLRLLVKGSQCSLNIEDKTSGQLFAKCFIEKYPGTSIEPVNDSSRYFVIKIKNEKDGRIAQIGIGFADRSDSFDLNVALQDHFKRIEKQEEIEKEFDKEDSSQPKLDLSLKEGQTIKVNLNICKKSTGSTIKNRPKTSSVCGILLPPPSVSKSSPSKPLSIPNAAEMLIQAGPSGGDKEFDPFSSKQSDKPTLLKFEDVKIDLQKPLDQQEEDMKWSDFESHTKGSSTSWENF